MFREEKLEQINKLILAQRGKKVAIWCLGNHTDSLIKYTQVLSLDILFF